MQQDDTVKLRLERYERLRDVYIPHTFVAMINKELAKYNTASKIYAFVADSRGWSVITTVPISYYHYGFIQRDEKEAVLYIEVTGKVCENSKPIGIDVSLKFSPELGFYNIKEVMDGLLGFSPKDQENRGVQEQYMLHKMVADAQGRTAAEVRQMTERMVSSLVEMGYSRRKAVVAATQSLATNPDEDNLDRLLANIVNKDLCD